MGNKKEKQEINLEKERCRATLEEFLNFPIINSKEIFERFATLPGAVVCRGGNKFNYVYVPGTRDDRVVLAAHADTVWDEYYIRKPDISQSVVCYDGVYTGANPDVGIGADDRAGCAILWLLKDMGHSLLILDGEEHGQLGARYLRRSDPELYNEINEHSYILQFDRRGGFDYKTYSLPVTKEFTDFVERHTGYQDAGKMASTDIVVLCNKICGANLSVGYYNEHHENESLVFEEWYHTLNITEKLLRKNRSIFY